MLNTSHSASLNCLIMFWIQCFSFLMASVDAEAASPWCFTPFSPIHDLYLESQPSLRLSHLSRGTPCMSANDHHFLWIRSPVSKNPSLQAIIIQAFSISVTSGWCVAHVCLADGVMLLSNSSFAHHIDLLLSQDNIRGCLSWRVGYMLLKCWAVSTCFLPFA